MRKGVAVLMVFVLTLCAIGCGGGTKGADSNSNKEESKGSEKTFVYLARDTANAYEHAQSSGFLEAIEDLGYEGIIRNAESSSAEKQIVIVEDLIAQGVAGIAICCNDAEALEPALQEAMNSGIAVVSVDAAASPDSVAAHIAQCDSEAIGKALAESVYNQCGGEGQYAVLSATSTSPEQAEWIEYMEKAMEDEKYAKLERVALVYGDDESEKSYAEAEGLLKSYPDLKTICCPTTVALMAAAKVITDQNKIGEITACGLGLPSEMAEYIANGACPEFALWSPIDCGYLAGCTIVAIATDEMEGEIGDTFSAGRLGDSFEIINLAGRKQVVLGEPLTFDASNIDEWKDIF